MADNVRTVVTDPDPTEAVKEALTLAIKNLDEKITQRLNANDKAVELAREEVKTAARDLAKSQADALEAALKATTDANTKLEQSFEKSNQATNEKIDRLTERINIWTGRDNTEITSKQDRSTDKSQTVALAAVFIALAALIFGVVMALRGH
jgi:tetrahydromethanopterin S-methyltransferase subunit B